MQHSRLNQAFNAAFEPCYTHLTYWMFIFQGNSGFDHGVVDDVRVYLQEQRILLYSRKVHVTYIDIIAF